MERFYRSATFSRSRRRFVQGLAGGTLAIVTARQFGWAAATDSPAAGDAGAVLSGSEFELAIGALPVNFTGQPGIATAVNGRLPAPLLRWREGDVITLRVSNRLSAPTSIHWHGLIVPADMDGVPGLSSTGLRPVRATSITSRSTNRALTGTTVIRASKSKRGSMAPS